MFVNVNEFEIIKSGRRNVEFDIMEFSYETWRIFAEDLVTKLVSKDAVQSNKTIVKIKPIHDKFDGYNVNVDMQYEDDGKLTVRHFKLDVLGLVGSDYSDEVSEIWQWICSNCFGDNYVTMLNSYLNTEKQL